MAGSEVYPQLTSPLKSFVPDELYNYVFTFPNFYSEKEDTIGALSQHISLASCHQIYSSVFKIIQDTELSEEQDSEGFKSSIWIDKTWKSFEADTNGKDVEWYKFLRMVLGVLIKIFQEELMLEVKLFFSRDQDEIFMKVRATEYNLRVQADLMDYQIQVNIPREGLNVAQVSAGKAYPKSGYSLICPYGEYQNKSATEENNNIWEIYKTYSHDGKKSHSEKDKFSVFQEKDRIRIVLAMITSVVDLGELLDHKIITQNYCLHDHAKLDHLKETWGSFSRFWKPQDFKALRKYFGEKITMYFAWLEYYLIWLIVPSIFGLAVYIAGDYANPISEGPFTLTQLLTLLFSLILSLGSTILDQLWIRRQNELAWMWGTSDMVEVEQQRPNFKGEYKTDDLTGHKRKIRPGDRETSCKRSFGFSVTLMFLACVLAMIIGIFIAKRDYSEYQLYFSMLNAFQIKIMNFVYRYVAKALNNWENYEYDSEYNDALTMKLYVFQFVNSYSSLFYIAFIKECGDLCMEELGSQLYSILLLNTCLNLVELGMPWLKNKLANRAELKNIEKMNLEGGHMRNNVTSVEAEAKLQEYETPLDDYMELIVNYGYVVMFSVAYPLFPFVSFILCILEVRVDAYKICFFTRKPYPAPANSIGIWEQIIRTISVVGALTNTGILVFTADFRFGELNKFLCFILIEHFLLLFKGVLMVLVPDTSSNVKNGIVWGNRISAEKIYGKAIDVEQQKKKRNLYFAKDKTVHPFILDPKNISFDNY